MVNKNAIFNRIEITSLHNNMQRLVKAAQPFKNQLKSNSYQGFETTVKEFHLFETKCNTTFINSKEFVLEYSKHLKDLKLTGEQLKAELIAIRSYNKKNNRAFNKLVSELEKVNSLIPESAV